MCYVRIDTSLGRKKIHLKPTKQDLVPEVCLKIFNKHLVVFIYGSSPPPPPSVVNALIPHLPGLVSVQCTLFNRSLR